MTRNENVIWMVLYHKLIDTQRCLPFTSSPSSHCKWNTPFCSARRICPIAENNAEKLEKLENLISDLSKYHYPGSLIKQRFQKALSIPQKDLQKPKKLLNESILPFITTFNPSIDPIIIITLIFIALLNPRFTVWKIIMFSGFHNIKLIQSKRQILNLKKRLTKAEDEEVLSRTFNYSDKRCECCDYLLINDHL